MTGIQTLVARAALGLAGICGGVLGTRTWIFSKGSWWTFERAAMAALVGSRLAIFALLFLVLHLEPRGDVPSYYFPQAEAVLHGLLPYRNFESSYAPLHPYFDAIPIMVWRSSVAIILLSVLGELGMFWVWLRFSPKLVSQRTARLAAILYVACPISLQYVTVDGQDNVLIALLLAIALLMMHRKQDGASGAVFALSVATIKFLPLIFLPVYLVAASRKLRWCVSCAVVLAVSYGTFAAMRLPLLAPFQYESGQHASGNLPFILECLAGRTLPDRLADGVVIAVVVGITTVLVQGIRAARLDARVRAAAFATAALTMDILLFAKKSWAGYMLLALFPICMIVARKAITVRRITAWSVAVMAALVEHSFWSSVMGQPSSLAVHRAAWSGDWHALTLIALDSIAVVGYGWLLVETLAAILRVRREEDRPNGRTLEQPSWADA